MFAAYVGCPLMAVLLTANIPVTTVLWYGVCAVTHSTCSASPSGSQRKQSKDAHSADGPGNSSLQQQTLQMQQQMLNDVSMQHQTILASMHAYAGRVIPSFYAGDCTV